MQIGATLWAHKAWKGHYVMFFTVIPIHNAPVINGAECAS